MPGHLGGRGLLIHQCSPFRLTPIDSSCLERVERSLLGNRKKGQKALGVSLLSFNYSAFGDWPVNMHLSTVVLLCLDKHLKVSLGPGTLIIKLPLSWSSHH